MMKTIVNTANNNNGYNVGWFEWSINSIFLIIYVWFILAIFDLVNDGGYT